MKILVIGDSCTDIFRYGEVNRLAPEAPVPIIKPETEVRCPGMAGNVVENLESLGADVDFVTNEHEIKKIRYVCSKYHHLLLRVDENDKCEKISQFHMDLISNHFGTDEKIYDAIIISDYNKGFLEKSDIEIIAKSFESPIFLDTKKELGSWCSDINYIKINSQEFNNSKSQIDASTSLHSKIIVTRGKHGCDYQGQNFPTTEVPVKDVSGAGDTFLAGLVVKFIETNSIKKAIDFAQECTTKVVQKTGVSVV